MLSTLLGFFIGISLGSSELFNPKIIIHPSDTMVSGQYDLTQAEEIYYNSNFIRSRPTVLFLHGYLTDSDSDLTKSVVAAYKKVKSFNILILDWKILANGSYFSAVLQLGELGQEIAKFIKKMTEKGYPIKKWHLVGHSLGGQLTGIVGREVQSLSNGLLKLPRISALDPAGPGFNLSGQKTVNKDDAAFVDVIHTDAGLYGALSNVGTVEFFPNRGGRVQPGCNIFSDIGGCSHGRSVDFWIESVENMDKNGIFTSQLSSNPTITAQMGLNCSINSMPGRYNLKTNSKPPYSTPLVRNELPFFLNWFRSE